MSPGFAHTFAAAGLLRQALVVMVLLNLSLPLLHGVLGSGAGDARSAWDIAATLIAPVMAPLLAVVILFDYIMSRVRAADAVGDEQLHFAAIARLEVAVIAISLIFWVPYFSLRIF